MIWCRRFPLSAMGFSQLQLLWLVSSAALSLPNSSTDFSSARSIHTIPASSPPNPVPQPGVRAITYSGKTIYLKRKLKIPLSEKVRYFVSCIAGHQILPPRSSRRINPFATSSIFQSIDSWITYLLLPL